MPKVRPFGAPIPYKGEQWVWVTISVKLKESMVRKWFGGSEKKRLKIFDGENHRSTEWERVDQRKRYPSEKKYQEKQNSERRAARAAASAAKAQNIEAAKMDVSGMTQEQLEALAAGVRAKTNGGPIEGPNPKKSALVPLPKDWSE